MFLCFSNIMLRKSLKVILKNLAFLLIVENILQALEKFEQNVKANDSNSERTLSDRRNIFKNVCPELMDREIIKIDDDTILDKYYY